MALLTGPEGRISDPVMAEAGPVGAGVVTLAGAPGGNGQVRLTFTSAEVGNGNENDSNTMAGQDGGLAVRAQGEDALGMLTGPVERYGDEGTTFVGATSDVRFDVRDLVSGVARGDAFEVVELGTMAGDVYDKSASSRAYYINAGMGNDTVTGSSANDFLVGGAGNDQMSGGLGNDSFIGGGGNDTILGGDGRDTLIFNIATDGADRVNLGADMDTVSVSGAGVAQVRLTFTSSEVGNDQARDSGTMTNQDGGLAVRMQAEDMAGALTGLETRLDDEGIRFVSATPGLTFDVRDLVSGVERGDGFEIVELGSQAGDLLSHGPETRSYYINGGMGDDTITGSKADDFLVGGAGNDVIAGGTGNDSFIGGSGDDTITGGKGSDTMFFNVVTDGADQVNLGTEDDVVNVSGPGVSQVRLMFTSSEVGNQSVNDSGLLTNQDGGLAVRLQAEDGAGMLTGATSRFDDEGISFVSTTPGMTFDVRDLVSGVARGDGFEVVQLGTVQSERLQAAAPSRSYYINAGQGNDTVTGGMANDFLVGGAGNDLLSGGQGNDSFIGGGGNDTMFGGAGNDRAIFSIATDGADAVNLNEGDDVFAVAGVAGTQIRLTFTSAEVGNGNAVDSNTMLNQDGALAVRLQGEDVAGDLTGGVTRVDDEGISFVSTTAGVTFDVRDLVSGVGRGDQFDVVQLGTEAGDFIDQSDAGAIDYYINAGMGNDTVEGGRGNDFLVGGAGDDVLIGGRGQDSFIGGGGADTILGEDGVDTLIYNVVTDGADQVNLGGGNDIVNVGGPGITQVRLSFTSAEVGNGNARDGNAMLNQDGGLAVRLQAEDAMGALTGSVARLDDEGMIFFSTTAGLKFDVRDLVSGVARGDMFDVVHLGIGSSEVINVAAQSTDYYVNAGMGNDTIIGGSGNDFLVGGAGNDRINTREGDDSIIGGSGEDVFIFSAMPGNDTLFDFVSGTDKIDLIAFGIEFDDLTFSAAGSNTVIGVDTDGNMMDDFTITLLNTLNVVESDFIFVA
ncbi:hypothetical protein GEU84_006345 [Fertoebacter nigrum]|uniref:Calcium-binding protein n=1 Tax=Fertoeibacter niger TaxID=2656921 RepID=A0A8X8GY66_9RHOB|nr:calcium-binding protein [Fertoeibacter niger]NUB43993.1 hypothetical protein [Fertoeibacter niger]